MRSTTVLACALCAAVAAGARPAAQRPSDDASVRDVVRRYVEARQRRDPRAIASLFTADADQRTTAGEWRRGREAVVPGTLTSSQRNPGSRRITVESVRFVTADVAIADGPYEIATPGAASPRRMWATIVLAREAGTWRITAIRNMVPTGP